ncbi:hypothetical protein BDA96_05G100700 [Sorghum bicolor]|uniref:Uncharacterized protein n=2 Tax=Sorghum bicolor TaxID=4558 RepID=A0A921UFB5_SORBI|nr:uncharacterized protein LOC110435793 [Sorghum bicolor]KAG0529468.1 hypothetical protein BDA96_05G100700 [Sorghum bicolor]KXG28213.1 hypothetical protein SORBI_3005G098100 [Sorghum bicolor]|eukprot:XP_021317510.1 uncharacterized protein LOC110435793 [Sorghum bicolor]
MHGSHPLVAHRSRRAGRNKTKRPSDPAHPRASHPRAAADGDGGPRGDGDKSTATKTSPSRTPAGAPEPSPSRRQLKRAPAREFFKLRCRCRGCWSRTRMRCQGSSGDACGERIMVGCFLWMRTWLGRKTTDYQNDATSSVSDYCSGQLVPWARQV